MEIFPPGRIVADLHRLVDIISLIFLSFSEPGGLIFVQTAFLKKILRCDPCEKKLFKVIKQGLGLSFIGILTCESQMMLIIINSIKRLCLNL